MHDATWTWPYHNVTTFGSYICPAISFYCRRAYASQWFLLWCCVCWCCCCCCASTVFRLVVHSSNRDNELQTIVYYLFSHHPFFFFLLSFFDVASCCCWCYGCCCCCTVAVSWAKITWFASIQYRMQLSMWETCCLINQFIPFEMQLKYATITHSIDRSISYFIYFYLFICPKGSSFSRIFFKQG